MRGDYPEIACKKIYGPILRILREHPGIHARDQLPELVQKDMHLTDEQVSARYPPETNEKRTVFEKRISASLNTLHRKGLTVSDDKGHWRLTEAGEESLESYTDII